jgi:hypothetical protein
MIGRTKSQVRLKDNWIENRRFLKAWVRGDGYKESIQSSRALQAQVLQTHALQTDVLKDSA